MILPKTDGRHVLFLIEIRRDVLGLDGAKYTKEQRQQ